MTQKDQLIEFMYERIRELEIENALLKKTPSKKAIKDKWGKVPYKKRHLKLISLNGSPVKSTD